MLDPGPVIIIIVIIPKPACRFQLKAATVSDLMPATVPI